MKNQVIRKNLAGKLKEYRRKSGLSAEQVGAAIGKSRSTVFGWENEHGQPDADMLMKLCTLYGIESISAFFDDAGADDEIPTEERELLSMFRDLTEPAQGTIMDVLRAFLGNPSMKRTP